MDHAKVLVLGDDTRSFLAIVRSLGRQGIQVHAAPTDFSSPSLASRYIAAVKYLPFWSVDGAAWTEAAESLIRAERYDLVIPCNELSLLPLQRHRERFAALTRLAIPDDTAIAALFDKQATRELALSVGGRVAPGGPAFPTDDPAEIFARYGTPLVLKPRRSYAMDRMAVRGQVRVCASPDSLAAHLPGIRPDEYIYEGFVPGHGVGVSILASRGRILQAFEHHRVRENESGSYYRVSAPLTPALEGCCAAMVAALGYTGVAMFEFRLGAGPDDWVLLEVNARPWGSMPLPVGLGVDLPFRWFKLLVTGQETPPIAYAPGIYGRNLVLDVRNTLSDLRQARRERRPVLRLAATRLAELGRVVTGRERYDTLVWDDPRPGLRELRSSAAAAVRRLVQATGLPRLRAARGMARSEAHAALGRALREGRERQATILFVCQGNICRSSFAAALLRHRSPIPQARLHVASAGMLPRPDRRTPPFGIQAAADRGIDLVTHRSVHLSRDAAFTATAILIFDDVNRQAIQRRYPGLRTPVLKLGHFASLDDPLYATTDDIADPIGCDLATYALTYNRIAAATDGLLDVLQAILPTSTPMRALNRAAAAAPPPPPPGPAAPPAPG